MLTHYLKTTVTLLNDLIETTENDIIDIKEAKHDAIFSRTKIKDTLLKSFENNKSLIDNEIAKLASADPDAGLETILDQEQHSLLDQMRNGLNRLHKKNQHYASLVISVSEFYNSLLNRIIPTEQVGYENHKAKYASFLHIKG